jgi:Pvc16 N-terminal domain
MTVLRDVSNTLKELLRSSIPELNSQNSVVFDSPADIMPTGSTTLSIFLYQILENGFLRNIDPKPIDTTRMQYPPLNLDLYYMFTPYAKDIENELLIMESILQIFRDKSVLRGDTLQGNLIASGNDEIRVIPNNITFDEINKLWERFPNKSYKLSAAYILSPVSIPSAKEPAKITRIVKKDINIYRKEIGK